MFERLIWGTCRAQRRNFMSSLRFGPVRRRGTSAARISSRRLGVYVRPLNPFAELSAASDVVLCSAGSSLSEDRSSLGSSSSEITVRSAMNCLTSTRIARPTPTMIDLAVLVGSETFHLENSPLKFSSKTFRTIRSPTSRLVTIDELNKHVAISVECCICNPRFLKGAHSAYSTPPCFNLHAQKSVHAHASLWVHL